MASDVKPEYPDYESVIHTDELRIHIDWPVLHEPPLGKQNNVGDLLFHPACVRIPTQPA